MCSIMGIYGDIDYDIFKKGLDETISRGPDMQRIIKLNKGYLGFNRLSIMGLSELGMQPFELNGSYSVCNGEIYLFRPIKADLIKKGYTFKSESDCEILLPLYKEYGVEMFKMLDAEFAMIIYDNENDKIIAARDPIGIRPLYYGYYNNNIIFASEPKNIVGLVKEIFPFPPGHYYVDGKFIKYADVNDVKMINPTLDEAFKNIHDKLEAGVLKDLILTLRLDIYFLVDLILL